MDQLTREFPRNWIIESSYNKIAFYTPKTTILKSDSRRIDGYRAQLALTEWIINTLYELHGIQILSANESWPKQDNVVVWVTNLTSVDHSNIKHGKYQTAPQAE